MSQNYGTESLDSLERHRPHFCHATEDGPFWPKCAICGNEFTPPYDDPNRPLCMLCMEDTEYDDQAYADIKGEYVFPRS